MRSIAPIQSSRSGLTGFLTNTGMSTPLSASAMACMANGLAEVRAPTHNMSIPYFKASSICSGVATSVATSMPVSFCTRLSHGSAVSPFPSNPPGLVRGFHTPARNILQPFMASCLAVSITCSSVSAEQGPAITNGRSVLLGRLSGSSSSSISNISFCCCFVFLLSCTLFRLSARPSSAPRGPVPRSVSRPWHRAICAHGGGRLTRR